MTTITWTVSSLDYEVSKNGLDNVATGSPVYSESSGYHIYTFNGSGSVTF